MDLPQLLELPLDPPPPASRFAPPYPQLQVGGLLQLSLATPVHDSALLLFGSPLAGGPLPRGAQGQALGRLTRTQTTLLAGEEEWMHPG